MIGTAIETGKYWDKAWSLVESCTKCSEGCRNCWLLAMDKRFHREGPVTFREDRLGLPLHVKKPTTWAIWSDLFHEAITPSQIINAFEVMASCPQHTFIVCTKRPERMAPVLYGQEGNWYLGGGDYFKNVILMTTAENQEMADKRIPELLKCSPFRLAVSIEPMLGPIDLRESGMFWTSFRDGSIVNTKPSWRLINWVICGAETGPKRRPCNLEWIRIVKDLCQSAGVPLWIKGLDLITGTADEKGLKYHSYISHDIAEWPDDLRIRQYPEGMR